MDTTAPYYDLANTAGDGNSVLPLSDELATQARAGLRAASAAQLADEASARSAGDAAEATARLAANQAAVHPVLDATADFTATIPSLIAGKTAGTDTQDMFTTQIHTGTPAYVRNPNFWAAGAASLESLGIWNSNNGFQIGFTAITRRHVLICNHVTLPNGATLRWVTRGNAVVERVLSISAQVAGWDLRVGTLNADLPDTIQPACILPADWSSWLRMSDQLVGFKNQFGVGGIAEIYKYGEDPSISGKMEMGIRSAPSNPSGNFSAWYESTVTGDSGNAMFAIIHGRLTILATRTDNAYGPFVGDYYSEIAAIVGGLGTLESPAFRHSVDISSIRGVGNASRLTAAEHPTAGQIPLVLEETGQLDPDIIPQGGGGGGGLAYFTSKEAVAGTDFQRVLEVLPNINTAAICSLVLRALNGGALAAVPSGDPDLGNLSQRGLGAVDWQSEQSDTNHAAKGARSVIGGGGKNNASTPYSWIPGGLAGITYHHGSRAWANGFFAVPGDRNFEGVALSRVSTSATPVALGARPTAGNPTEDYTAFHVDLQSCYTFQALVVARSETDGLGKGWKVEGVVKCGATKADIALVGTPTVTPLGGDTGTESWALAVTTYPGATTPASLQNRLQLMATGEAGKTIRWNGDLFTVKVGGTL